MDYNESTETLKNHKWGKNSAVDVAYKKSSIIHLFFDDQTPGIQLNKSDIKALAIDVGLKISP